MYPVEEDIVFQVEDEHKEVHGKETEFTEFESEVCSELEEVDVPEQGR